MAENFYTVHRAFGHVTEDGRQLYFTQANGHEIDEAIEAEDLPKEKVQKLIDLGHLDDGRLDPADVKERRIEYRKATHERLEARKAEQEQKTATRKTARTSRRKSASPRVEASE